MDKRKVARFEFQMDFEWISYTLNDHIVQIFQ